MLHTHWVMLHKALLCLFPVTRITKESVMNNVQEILQAIFIGLAVANFLFNIGRGSNAIELCKETLVLLNDTIGTMVLLPDFILWGPGYESVYYGINNTRPIYSERAHRAYKILKFRLN